MSFCPITVASINLAFSSQNAVAIFSDLPKLVKSLILFILHFGDTNDWILVSEHNSSSSTSWLLHVSYIYLILISDYCCFISKLTGYDILFSFTLYCFFKTGSKLVLIFFGRSDRLLNLDLFELGIDCCEEVWLVFSKSLTLLDTLLGFLDLFFDNWEVALFDISLKACSSLCSEIWESFVGCRLLFWLAFIIWIVD